MLGRVCGVGVGVWCVSGCVSVCVGVGVSVCVCVPVCVCVLHSNVGFLNRYLNYLNVENKSKNQ